jgi:hypothetical protein
LNGQHNKVTNDDNVESKYVYNETVLDDPYTGLMPGPPFVFGALMVVLAILVAAFIPEAHTSDNIINRRPSSGEKRSSYSSKYAF